MLLDTNQLRATQTSTMVVLAQVAEADTSFDPSASGRIGPRTVRLDEASAAGDIRIDDLTVESLSNFSSARATTAVFKAGISVPFILPPSVYEPHERAFADRSRPPRRASGCTR